MMKFIASNVDAAKAKARRALGEKAVIVATRDLPSGDVEVTASNRPPATNQPQNDQPPPSTPQNQNAPALGAALGTSKQGASNFAAEAREAIDQSALRGNSGSRLNEALEQRFSEDALSKLRGGLSDRGARQGEIPLSDMKMKALYELLNLHGLSDALMRDMIASAASVGVDDDYHRLETAFIESFSFAPLGAVPTTPIMLVGPTGAGKTSSSARLAKTAMEHTGAAFMMTADVGRAGAIEQIKIYGDSLGADYYIVETPMDVEQAIPSAQAGSAIILDTPGVSPFDAGDIAALKSFQQAAGAEPILVLPASGDAVEFTEWAMAFAEFGVRRAILTKFDATKRVGAGLCALHAANIGLCYFAESAFISDGLIPATPEFLTRRFLVSWPGQVG